MKVLIDTIAVTEQELKASMDMHGGQAVSIVSFEWITGMAILSGSREAVTKLLTSPFYNLEADEVDEYEVD